MTQNAYPYQMPAGIPGVASRLGGRMPEIEAQVMDPDHPLPAYGLFGKIGATGLFRTLETTDTNAEIFGPLVRPYPQQPAQAPSNSVSGSTPLGTQAVPPQNQATIDVMRSGRMTVLLRGATAAAKGGIIYVRVDNADATHPLGGVEAADDGANTVPLDSKSYFMGPADSNGNVEIAFNI